MASRDMVGEMKSHASLSETNRRLNRWQQSCTHSMEYLRLSRQLNDRFEECGALQLLGDVYLSKAQQGSLAYKDTEPGCYPPDVTEDLSQSSQHLQEGVCLARQLGDDQLLEKGLCLLGHTSYLMGRFSEGVTWQQERCEVCERLGDEVALFRSHASLANCLMYLGETERALQHYKHSIRLVVESGNVRQEADCCYSLGNCCLLLKQFSLSADHFLRCLQLCTQMHNKAGSMRASWGLSQSFSCLGRDRDALRYARLQLSLATELSCRSHIEVAEHNVSVIQRHNLRHKETDPEREVMLEDELISPVSQGDITEIVMEVPGNELPPEDHPNRLDHFLIERLFHSQGSRLEEQRCPITPSRVPKFHTSKSVDELILLIADRQVNRLEDQRAPLSNRTEVKHVSFVDEGISHFLERCQDRSLKDQRSSLGRGAVPQRAGSRHKPEEQEDFYNLIMQAQSNRLEDQRTSAPIPLL